MKVTVCQLEPDRALRADYLSGLRDHATAHGTDLVLLPELPFSAWLAADPKPDAARWADSVAAHGRAVAGLGDLGARAVVGTRPVMTGEGRRRNQAFVWTDRTGRAEAVRDKHYLPDEEGYWERSWFEPGERSFDTAHAGAAVLGIQICTEMWFLEWARHYAASGVEVLCIPRATPRGTTGKWLAGGRTAAVCSGAFCLSSNQWHAPGASPADCGGVGWVIDPDGEVLATTSGDEPFATVHIDLDEARQSKSTYPRYVRE